MNIKDIYILDCSGSMTEDQINAGIARIGNMIEARENGIRLNTCAIFFWSELDPFDSFSLNLKERFPQAKLHLICDGLFLQEDLKSIDTVDIIDYDHPFFGQVDVDHYPQW